MGFKKIYKFDEDFQVYVDNGRILIEDCTYNTIEIPYEQLNDLLRVLEGFKRENKGA